TTKANAEDSAFLELVGLTPGGKAITIDPTTLFTYTHGVGLRDKLREYEGLKKSQEQAVGTQPPQSKLKWPLKQLAEGIRWAFREKEANLAAKKKQLDDRLIAIMERYN